jgi:hypothetical protein
MDRNEERRCAEERRRRRAENWLFAIAASASVSIVALIVGSIVA